MQLGKLVYVMGASGVGKDTLLAYARGRLAERPFAFAHRYITRPATAGGEVHIPLSEPEFALRLERGLFALSWDSHGLRYGIGREIDQWREQGIHVVVNGARGAVVRALGRYPDLVSVLITASPEKLRERLEGRARESGADLEERLSRAAALPQIDAPLIRIDNDGSREAGGARLTDALCRVCLSSALRY